MGLKGDFCRAERTKLKSQGSTRWWNGDRMRNTGWMKVLRRKGAFEKEWPRPRPVLSVCLSPSSGEDLIVGRLNCNRGSCIYTKEGFRIDGRFFWKCIFLFLARWERQTQKLLRSPKNWALKAIPLKPETEKQDGTGAMRHQVWPVGKKPGVISWTASLVQATSWGRLWLDLEARMSTFRVPHFWHIRLNISG